MGIPLSATSPPDTSALASSIRLQLIMYYVKHNEHMLEHIDAIVRKYDVEESGQNALLRELRYKYGVCPKLADLHPTFMHRMDVRGSVRDFYRRQNPARLPDVEALMKRYKGHEGLLLEALSAKYIDGEVWGVARTNERRGMSTEAAMMDATSPGGLLSTKSKSFYLNGTMSDTGLNTTLDTTYNNNSFMATTNKKRDKHSYEDDEEELDPQSRWERVFHLYQSPLRPKILHAEAFACELERQGMSDLASLFDAKHKSRQAPDSQDIVDQIRENLRVQKIKNECVVLCGIHHPYLLERIDDLFLVFRGKESELVKKLKEPVFSV
eukprot:PhF_6_TR11244/c0_g2_i1/m.18136